MYSVVSIGDLYSIPMSQYVNLNSVDKHRFTSRLFLRQTACYYEIKLQIYIKLQHFMNMSSQLVVDFFSPVLYSIISAIHPIDSNLSLIVITYQQSISKSQYVRSPIWHPVQMILRILLNELKKYQNITGNTEM